MHRRIRNTPAGHRHAASAGRRQAAGRHPVRLSAVRTNRRGLYIRVEQNVVVGLDACQGPIVTARITVVPVEQEHFHAGKLCTEHLCRTVRRAVVGHDNPHLFRRIAQYRRQEGTQMRIAFQLSMTTFTSDIPPPFVFRVLLEWAYVSSVCATRATTPAAAVSSLRVSRHTAS